MINENYKPTAKDGLLSQPSCKQCCNCTAMHTIQEQLRLIALEPENKLSQNHEPGEGGRDLWGSYGPTPLLGQDHPEWIARDCVQTVLEYLWDGDSTTTSGNPCQCVVILPGKNCFLMLRGNFMCFRACPWAATGHHQGKLGSLFFIP